MSDELTPITRKETFLAKAGGQNVVTPTPITREETFLQAIIDNGSGGGGGGGVLKVSATTGAGIVTLDKTWKEISEAPFAVIAVSFTEGWMNYYPLIFTTGSEGSYHAYFEQINMDGTSLSFAALDFNTDSETGYPYMTF